MVPDPQRQGKLSSKGVPVVYLGVEDESKSWRYF